jgi:phosphatidylserine decarboxylase
MKIHKAGYKIIVFTSLILLALLAAVHFIFAQFAYLRYGLYALDIAAILFIIRFFRYPNRTLEENPNAVYAPADGTIVVIEEVSEDKLLHEKRMQLSIFMSVLNVHVNFFPISGEVIEQEHFPGDKMVAWHPKSSELNEHTTVVVEDAQKRKVLVKQIAGALARRIVCRAKKGMQVEQGEELGMIKFGSRVDVLLPTNARINVKMNEKVRAKKTVLAYFE